MALQVLIAALAPGEAAQLAERLASGQLDPAKATATKLTLKGLSPTLAAPLNGLATSGWTAAQLADVLAVIEQSGGAPIEVISTQPEGASDLLMGTAYSLKSLLLQAKTSVLIAGYSISQREILEPLVRLPAQQLEVELFVNVPTPKQPVKSVGAWANAWWRGWLNDTWPVGLEPPAAWFAPSQVDPEQDAKYRKMHMKTVVVDDETWFVSSANFSYHGHHQNFELGAKVVDMTACAQVRAHFQAMCAAGVFERLRG